MRWICCLLISLFLSGGLVAQDKKTIKETKKEISQRKKEEKKAKIDSIYRCTDTLLTGRRFVLEAQFLRNNVGARVNVISTLNFISIDSLSAVIQVGSTQRFGYNGVGGVTVQGRVINWKLEKDDKKNDFFLTMTIQGNVDIYDINMTIDYEGYTTATLNGVNTGKLIYEGNIVSLEKTSVFKGQAR
jgi:hypothetical protein